MPYRKPLLALLVLLTASLALACTSGDDSDANPTQGASLEGDVLTSIGVGDGVSGAFLTEGVFDVRVDGDDVTIDNSRLIVYQLTPIEEGYQTAIVTGSGPKAVAEGVTQRPGPILDMTFAIGEGEYYVLLKTDSPNTWTMTVTGVAGAP